MTATSLITFKPTSETAPVAFNTSSVGSVSFASPVAVSNGYWYNAIGDFNNDGKNDFAVRNGHPR